MQTEVPALPVVCSDGRKRSTRNPDINAKSSPVEVKNNTSCKNSSFPVSNRKQLHPLVGGPYRNSMRLYGLSEPVKSTNKDTVVQRVTSAKMLRVKQLQNQLTDAHYHLNELANENRLLKALQKRQDSALKRYEGTNAELPRIINSHHEELKVLQTKHKKLRTQHKHTCDLLKEKENEIHSLQTQNKHLIQLSKDRQLEEREKLQMRVSDLNFRIEQQQETIQTLNRKLALESKSLKHQLNAEVAKHKETQKHLHEALDKLKNLEDMLDNREKRLYYSGRLPVCNKGKSVGSQSLVNLRNNGAPSNPLKSGSKNRESQNDLESGSLPKLTGAESSEGKTISNLKADQDTTAVTETMSSLQQVRKFRLQKSYSRNGSAGRPNDSEKFGDEAARIANSGSGRPSYFEKLKAKHAVMNEDESENDEVEKLIEDFEITNRKGPYKLPKQLKREFGYSSSESENEEDTKTTGALEYESSSLINKSRDLHNRLIGGETTIPDSVGKQISEKKNLANTSESESDGETEKVKTFSITKENYRIALRRGSSRAEDIPSSMTVGDFLKLDINATDSDLEMERLRNMNAEQIDKPLDSLMVGGYENSQQRLLNITKSWTELQERIKREREISGNQLKAMNDGSLADLLEKKLIDADSSDNLEKQRRLSSEKCNEPSEDSFGRSTQSQKKLNDRGRLSIDENAEIPHSLQNGAIEDSKTDEITTGGDGHATGKESESTANVNDLINKIHISPNLEDAKKASSDESRKLATEENGITNGEVHDERSEPTDIKIVNYNKQKLLAAMKAIDDNENIEFLTNQKHRAGNTPIRSQTTITENLYRGLPAHARKKDDILKEIFGDAKTETKLRAGCSKLH